MSEKICIRCGQVLSSHAQVCPDCLAVQKRLGRTATPQSFEDIKDKPSEFVFDTNAKRMVSNMSQRVRQTATTYGKTQNTRGWFVLGFVLGWVIPFVFNIIILIVLKSSVQKNSQSENLAKFRKGMVRGMIIMQVILPVVLAVLGWLIENYI